MPPRQDGSKRPDGKWKQYQTECPSRDEVARWWPHQSRATGVGIFCGAASSDADTLEFDDAEVYERFGAAAEQAGIGDLLRRVCDGWSERSPGGGVHLYFRCPTVPGNTKLARRPTDRPQLDKDGDPVLNRDGSPRTEIDTLIETRGTGGWIIVAPSHGRVHPSGRPYVRIAGGPRTIATLTLEEREDLWRWQGRSTRCRRRKPRPRPSGQRRTCHDQEQRIAMRPRAGAGAMEGPSRGRLQRPRLLGRHPPGLDLRPQGRGDGVLAPARQGRRLERLDQPQRVRSVVRVQFLDGVRPGAVLQQVRRVRLPGARGRLLGGGRGAVHAGYGVRDESGGGRNGHHAGDSAATRAASNGQRQRAGATAQHDDDHPIEDHRPVLDDHALHGIVGEIVRKVDPHTESHQVATLMQFLVAFGSLVGRGPHFVVSATKHYLNLFLALVGPTASGRKGTSWDVVLWLLSYFDQPWADERIQGGLVSGEGLISHVRDAVVKREPKRTGKGGPITGHELTTLDEGVADKRLLVVETELSRMFKAMNREANTLSDVARQAWDGRRVLQTMAKGSPNKATEAHISIVGHTTRADVLKHLSETDSANGFGNRFLWASVWRTKVLPDGGNLAGEDWAPIRQRLEEIIGFARLVGKMTRDQDARAIWHAVYEELSGARPGLLGAILGAPTPRSCEWPASSRCWTSPPSSRLTT